MFYTAGMCDVTYIGVYNTYLHGKCFLSAPYNIQSLSACLVTQVHACIPYLKAVHYAQTNVTFPAEIQCGPCLILQQTHTAPTPCFCGRPVLRMLYFQSTELECSCTWSAPRNATSCHIFLLRIINSRTSISRNFLCVILPPHDLCIRNVLRMVMSVR